MVNFSEHFWGDKHNGFDVLQQNFKLGLNASKEFADFLKERSNIEESYSKSLLKLAHKCAAANNNVGIFEPCWKFLQSSTEKLANVHSQVILHLNDVSKAVREYGEQQKEKQKHMKDDFSSTNEAVQNLQQLSVALLKTKEAYHQRSQEVEKYRKEMTNLKDIKTAETKYKKSTEEYKQMVERREIARKEFQEKITEMSQKLQTVEESHLKQMLELLSKYGESIKVERFLLEQIIDEFGRNMVALTVDKLLQQFINLKQTGKDVPAQIDFEEITLETQPVDLEAVAQALKEEKQKRKKEKQNKRAERKTKKKEKTTVTNGSVEKVSEETVEPVPEGLELDEEGYVIRKNSDSIQSGKNEDSDSDWNDSDSDDDNQKIQVRIKPVEANKPGSNSDLTDEQLKKLTTTLTLMSPASVQQKMQLQKEEKKLVWGSSGSLNKLSAKSRSNNDLLGIDKNSDTASLHSLPMNSSIPCLDLNSPTMADSSSDNNLGSTSGGGATFDASFSSSPMASPLNEKRGGPGSTNLSPAESIDRSVDSLGSRDLEPPPLPMKARTLSGVCSTEQNSKESSSESLNILKPTTVEEPSKNTDAISTPEINMFSNKLFMEDPIDKTKSLPARGGLVGLEPLKPPPTEKRTSATLRGPPGAGSSKVATGSGTSVPRPKPGQLIAPPASGPSRRNTMHTQQHTTTSQQQKQPQPVAVPPSTSASAAPQPPNVASNSSLSDLLDINFSSTAPTLAPVTTSENTTAHWVNPDLTESTSNDKLAATNTTSSTKTTSSTSSASLSQAPLVPTKSPPNETTNSLLQPTATSTGPVSPNIQPLAPPAQKQPPKASSAPSTNTKQSAFEENSTPPALPRRNTTGPLAPPPQVTPAAPTTAGLAASSGAQERAIPIAVAFMETINGVFKGADEKSCIVRVTGDMTISFPANIISMLSNNASPPVLSFLVNGTSSLEQIFPNKALVERGGQLPGGEGMTFKFNMAALAAYLKKQSEQGTRASYYNIDILKYQVRCSGMNSAPLQLSAHWRCDPTQTDLKIDYKYNPTSMSSPVALNNVSVVVPIDGGVTIMQSKPTAIWSSEHQRCMWKLAAISSNAEDGGTNALRARFDITQGPTTCVPIAIQFTGEGSTISALNFDLTSNAYKLSLVKKRLTSGKYIVEKER
ncbi:F-BAR domain only protein 2-like [Clytia hemisphaerica]|uniref:F-BAR domain only protein 2 n=1 Tax=Clytia hemisphaerica TaxID=252671 RepID=A0A7M5UYJ6_9CNID